VLFVIAFVNRLNQLREQHTSLLSPVSKSLV
jgi:hypothetical protein